MSLALPTLEQLGVSRNIEDVERALTGIRFLLAMFAETKTPFFLFIDQIERLVLDTEPAVAAANRGHLHGLVELGYHAKGFLCFGGMTKAWETFPIDFLQRFSTPPFRLPSLSPEQVRSIVAVYLNPIKQS